MTMKKTTGQSKPTSEAGAKKTPAGRAELRAELVRELSKLEARDDRQILRNFGNMNAVILELSEFKRVLILILKAVLDE